MGAPAQPSIRQRSGAKAEPTGGLFAANGSTLTLASARLSPPPIARARRGRVRMPRAQRREQLIDVARALFADKGLEGTSVEEIATRAAVSKPVVYEHFGGKEGMYAVIVDREVQKLTGEISRSLDVGGHPRAIVERTSLSLLDYIEANSDGFRILVRDSPVTQTTGTFSSVIGDVASQVEHILDRAFKAGGFETKLAGLYSQALVGMVAATGQWWLEARNPKKEVVAAHLVNLAWNGLAHLDTAPTIRRTPRNR